MRYVFSDASGYQGICIMKRTLANRRVWADTLTHPSPHTADIDMDEIGIRVIADAAYLHC